MLSSTGIGENKMKVLHTKIKENINPRQFGFLPVTPHCVVFEMVVQVLVAINATHLTPMHCYWRQINHNTIEVLLPNTCWTPELKKGAFLIPGVESVGHMSFSGTDQNVLVVVS